MSTLESPAVSGLLKRLFEDADRADPAAMARAQTALALLKEAPSARHRAELMRDVYMPISPDVGRLLYILARNRPAKVMVEFAASFGISGIHLAAAARDAGGGRLITTELDPVKAEQAARNFRASGLSEFIDLRVGDAFETLKSGIDGTSTCCCSTAGKRRICRCSNSWSRGFRLAHWWWRTISRSHPMHWRPTSTTCAMPATAMCRSSCRSVTASSCHSAPSACSGEVGTGSPPRTCATQEGRRLTRP
jgi:hypothetical protein